MALRSAFRSTIPPVLSTTRTMSSVAAPTHNYAPRAGFDDSGSSGLYHTARPDYPRESIQAILKAAASDSNAAQLNVLEIGSGTGISTECLVREAGETNLKIRNYLAVEPSHGMRAGWNDFIASKLLPDLVKQGKLPSDASVECRDGTFEQLNLSKEQKGTFDTVVIAQAYHWCPDYERSLQAILEALRPGGKLALIWNLEDNTTDAKWVKELRDLYEVYEDNTPQCAYACRARHAWQTNSFLLISSLPDRPTHVLEETLRLASSSFFIQVQHTRTTLPPYNPYHCSRSQESRVE